MSRPTCLMQSSGCYMFAEPDHCEGHCYASPEARAKRAAVVKACGGPEGHLNMIRVLATVIAMQNNGPETGEGEGGGPVTILANLLLDRQRLTEQAERASRDAESYRAVVAAQGEELYRLRAEVETMRRRDVAWAEIRRIAEEAGVSQEAVISAVKAVASGYRTAP